MSVECQPFSNSWQNFATALADCCQSRGTKLNSTMLLDYL